MSDDTTRLDGAWAERFVKDAYGLTANAEPLAGEFDLNFLVQTSAGERWLLKVSPQGADVAALECQIAALRYLEESPLASLIQRVGNDPVAECRESVEGLPGVRVHSKTIFTIASPSDKALPTPKRFTFA